MLDDLLEPSSSGSGPGGSVGPAADTTPPVFTNIVHTPQYPGPTMAVNMTATISDADPNLNVTLYYGYDNSTWKNVSATGSSGVYTGFVPAAGTNPKVWCYFSATDSSNNSADSQVTEYLIDKSKPTVVDVTTKTDIIRYGTPFPIFANITDNTRISSVIFNWSNDNSTWSQVAMSRASGIDISAKYVKVLAVPAKNTTYYYNVHAYDEAGHHGSSTTVNLTWNPSPYITNVFRDPDWVNDRVSVTVSAIVTDDDGVSLVWINYTANGVPWTRINATKGASNNWSVVVPEVTGSTYVDYRLLATDTDGGTTKTSQLSWDIDYLEPKLRFSEINGTIIGPKDTVKVTAGIVDNSGPVDVKVQYGYDNTNWSNVSATSLGGAGSTEDRDRNPASGYGYGVTLSRTYDLDDNPSDKLHYLYIYCYTSDSNSLYVNVEGYVGATGPWERIFYQYSYTPGSGTKVDGFFTDKGYTKWRINYRDYQNNDYIYYNCTYTHETATHEAVIPESGNHDTVYYRYNATDMANNSLVSGVYSYPVDWKVPIIVDDTRPTVGSNWINAIPVYSNVTDNLYLRSAFINWSTDGVTWTKSPMAKLSGTTKSGQFLGYLPTPSKNTTYHVRIGALDYPYNLGNTTTTIFYWNPPPWIWTVGYTPAYPVNSTDVTITSDVRDDDTVSKVHVNYTTDHSTWTTVSAVKGAGTEWSAVIPKVSGVHRMYYVVWAEDIETGLNRTVELSYYVDEVPPTIHTPFTEPPYANASIPITVQANMTDVVGIRNATVMYRIGTPGSFTELAMTQQSDGDALTVGCYLRLTTTSYWDNLQLMSSALGSLDSTVSGFGGVPPDALWTDVDCIILDAAGSSSFYYINAVEAARAGKLLVMTGQNWNSARSYLGNPNYTSHTSFGYTSYGMTVGKGALIYVNNLYNNGYLGYSWRNYNADQRARLVDHLKGGHETFMPFGADIPKTTTGATVYYRVFATDNSNLSTMTPLLNYTTDGVLPQITAAAGAPSGGYLYMTSTHPVWVNVIDETGIGDINVVYSYDNGATWSKGALSRSSGTNTSATYTGYVPAPNINCWVWFYYEAHDRADNIVLYPTGSPYSYKAADNPTLSDITHTPQRANGADPITFGLNVTDLDGTAQVVLSYWVNTGSATNVNMNWQSGNYWNRSITNPGVSRTLHYSMQAYDIYGFSTTSSNYSIVIDADPPFVSLTSYYPTYPNSTTANITVKGTVVDLGGNASVYFDYKYGSAGSVSSVYQGQAVRKTSNDRNPTSGTVRATSLIKTYDLVADLHFLSVYIFSSDNNTLYINIEGYTASSSRWERIYYQYAYAATSGTRVNHFFPNNHYTKWRINYRDYQNNGDIYYNCTYITQRDAFGADLTAPGYTTWMNFRIRAIDEVGNVGYTTWTRVWIDGVNPTLDSHMAPLGQDAFDDVTINANFVDEARMDYAHIWFTMGGSWYHINMTKSTFNGTHLRASVLVPASGIPLKVTYYFIFWDSAGNYNTTGTYSYSTKFRTLTEGTFYTFDAWALNTPNVSKFEWDFTYDGTFSADRTGKDARYRYYDNGTYTMVLKITDKNGNASLYTYLIMVMDQRPSAIIGEFGTISEGDVVTFDGSPSISWPDDIVSYEWDFSYDGTTFNVDETGMAVNHTFMSDGSHRLALRVIDDDGSVGMSDITITILDSKPSLMVQFPKVVDEGVQMTFNTTGTLSWPDAIDRFEWDVDYDGVTFDVDYNGDTVNHTYMDNGIYRFLVIVYDSDGSMIQFSNNIRVDDLAPTGNISAMTTVDEGSNLLFNASGSMSFPDAIVKYEWDYHFDGTFLAEHDGFVGNFTYLDNGTYTVAMRVWDDDGSYCQTHVDIDVLDLGPTAVIQGPTTIDEGTTFTVSGVLSHSYPDQMVKFEWDFDYDGATFNREVNGPEVSHTYYDNGSITIALKVFDDDGTEAIDVLVIHVRDLGPTADLVVTGEYTEGSKLILDTRGSSSYPDALAIHAWDLHYDGEFNIETTGELIEYTYMDNGTFTIAFLLTDDDGTTDIIFQNVTITDMGPTAAVTADDTRLPEGALVIVSAGSSSSYPDKLMAYHWDWEGDGEVDETTLDFNGRHTFTKPGVYEIVLTVEDDDGSTDVTSVSITITNVGPTARLDVKPTPEGQRVFLDASGSTEPGSDFAFFRWDLDGDKVWDVEETCSTLDWVWTEPGQYSILVEVEDADGSKDSKSTTLLINDVAPVADAGGPYEVDEGTPLTISGLGTREPGGDYTVLKWDVNGDGKWNFEGLDMVVVWTYNVSGDYVIKLYVEDEDGSSDEVTVTVTVRDLEPVFDVVLPTDVREGVMATFTLGNVFDPGTVEFEVHWNFADGGWADGFPVEHTFSEQGQYAGWVTVEDNDGTIVRRMWSSPLSVANSPPEVELSEPVLKAVEDSEYTVSVFGQDTANDTVTYSVEGPGGTIDPVTGVFTWTPLDEHVGNNTFFFIASDEDGGETRHEAYIDVEDVDNDFLGMSTAGGLGLILLMVLIIVVVLLMVARQRGMFRSGAAALEDDDIIEPEAKADLRSEVEVDLEGPAPQAPEAPPTPVAAPLTPAEPPAAEAPQRPRPVKKVRRPPTQ